MQIAQCNFWEEEEEEVEVDEGLVSVVEGIVSGSGSVVVVGMEVLFSRSVQKLSKDHRLSKGGESKGGNSHLLLLEELDSALSIIKISK